MRARTLMGLIAAGALAVGLIAFSLRFRSQDSPGTSRTSPSDAESEAAVREFLRVHGDAVDRRVDDSMRKDPGYRSALLKLDESQVRAQRGLSEEEKAELWRSISRAQRRAQEQR